jgi:Flp pilus assembly protein TadB
MLVVSHLSEHTEADQAKAKSIRQSGRAMPMTKQEAAMYGLFITALVVTWLIVLLFFSPTGVA